MSLNIQETIFKANDIIGVDEVGPGVREVTVAQLLFEGKMLGHAERDEAIAKNYDMTIESVSHTHLTLPTTPYV